MMRPATRSDLESVVWLLDLAFAPSRFESGVVRALIENARPIHHWLSEGEGGVDAYVCYSRAYRGGEPIGFHLAPVAVRPDRQRKGHGSAVIRATLVQPPMSGKPVFVLGAPAYYARFGFRRISQPTCPFDPNGSHFMARHYRCRDEFVIGYESEFMNGEPGAARNGGPGTAQGPRDAWGGGSQR